MLGDEKDAKCFVLRMKIIAWQTIVVFVLTLIIGIILGATTDYLVVGDYSIDLALFWLDLVRNLSFGLAMYHFMTLIKTLSRDRIFKPLKLNKKTAAALGLVLVTMPQPIIIGIIAESGGIADTDVYDPEEVSVFTYSLLVIIEMIALAFLQIFIFPVSHLKKFKIREKEDN